MSSTKKLPHLKESYKLFVARTLYNNTHLPILANLANFNKNANVGNERFLTHMERPANSHNTVCIIHVHD